MSVTVGNVTKIKPDIQFYCGLNEISWNWHHMGTGPYVMVAPVSLRNEKKKDGTTKRKLRETSILISNSDARHIYLDSGAFSDLIELEAGKVVENKRLSFDHALQRQIGHAYKYHYAHLVEGIVSYDLLIDEVWKDGERSKDRWSVEAAEYAVSETVKAAAYLANQRQRINQAFGHPVKLILSAQGVEAEQYARCASQIVRHMDIEHDVFGLGGWCIAGLRRHVMLPAAAQILPGVFEVLGNAGVKHTHIFGVIYPELLGFVRYLCDLHGMDISTDSAGPCTEPAMFDGRWGYGSHTNPAWKVPPVLDSCKHLDEDGNKAPTCTPDMLCRGQARAAHVAFTRKYLANFREMEPDLVKMIQPPKISPYEQLTWLVEAVS